jgi:hypothetical protein
LLTVIFLLHAGSIIHSFTNYYRSSRIITHHPSLITCIEAAGASEREK